MRRLTLLSRRRDRGAAAIILVVLFSSGVLVGCAALTVDVGQIYTERRVLQNGADASSRSLAQTCFKAPVSCNYSGANTIGTGNPIKISDLNDRNAGADQKSGLNSSFNTNYDSGLCARNPGTSLGDSHPCASSTGTLTDCLPLPPYMASGDGATIPYVEVHNITKTSSGTTILPSVFARALTGSSGTAVSSCSRTAWGSPGGDDGGKIPISISGCDWQKQTGGTSGGGGGAYYPAPVYTGGAGDHGYGTGAGQSPYPTAAPPLPAAQVAGREIIVVFQDPSAAAGTNTCQWTEHTVDHTLPGGFSMLETTADPCEVKSYPFKWMHTDPGSSVSCDLSTLVGTVLYIPVFDCTHDSLPAGAPPNPLGSFNCHSGNGSNAYYHRQGYAKFYLSGYHITTSGSIPNTVKSLVNNAAPCNGGTRCLSGWFVSGTIEDTILGGGPSASGFFGTVAYVAAG